MNKEDIIDKILRNEPLTPVEQSWWDDHHTSEEVQDELNMIREMEGSLRLENRNLLKAQLQGFEQKNESTITVIQHKKKGPIPLMTNWWRIAATLAFMAVAITLIYRNVRTDYLSEFYKPYPSIIDPLVKGDTPKADPGTEAIRAYQNKNYQLVIDFLNQTNPLSDTLLFYKANALISVKRNREALTIMQELSGYDNRFRQESEWYGALLLLDAKKSEAARVFLEKITANETHPYFKEANDLILIIQ